MARSGAKKWLWLGAGVALLPVAALILPFLVPLSGFIPQITQAAGRALGQPVAIAGLRLHLLPKPRAAASGIRVGKQDDVTVDELVIVPELMALLAGRIAVSELRASKVEVKESALAMLTSMPKVEGDPVKVKRVVLREVTFHHSAFKLPPFDIQADLADDLSVEQALFTTRDGALKLAVDPQGGGVSTLDLTAKNWRIPAAAAPLTFDALTEQGTKRGKQIELPKIEGKLYGGSLSGSAKADWTKQWQVGGKIDFAGVDVAKVQQAIGNKPALSGKLQASTTFSATAKAPDQLANALALDGPFSVVEGALQGVDLSKVADLSLVTGRVAAGGSTRFDELHGKLHLRGRRIRVNELCARSPVLVAGGFIELAPDRKLSGKLDVSVAKTRGFVGVPVALSGTATDPIVMPSKGYTVGAIVGTVLLPGIGTALGGSAGSAVEGRSGCK